MLCKVMCGAISGMNVIPITVEVDVTPGIAFYLVGLPGNAVKESQQRISSSLQKIGFKIPGKKIIINLAPANIKKDGSAFDLPIAIAILAASGQISIDNLIDYFIAGELALDSSLRGITGALPLITYAKENGYKGIILPTSSAYEGIEIEDINIYAADTVKDVITILQNPSDAKNFLIQNRDLHLNNLYNNAKGITGNNINDNIYDFKEIKGQILAKKGLEVAAAGGHNILMIGSPGSGKTLLAKTLSSIMPPLSKEESIQVSTIYSISGQLNPYYGLMKQRPFRQPHHTSTIQALIGGGAQSLPGEISLAHCGVLFLDEFAEFPRSSLEVLRQPLEEGIVQISRVRSKISYPASFILVAAMNPCPCGYFDDNSGKCRCSSSQIEKYRSKISGPLLDRIDIASETFPLSFYDISKPAEGEPSSEIRKRVIAARNIQAERFKDEKGVYCNAQMSERMIQKYVKLDNSGTELLRKAMESLNLSARAYSRILKVARTIADLEGSENIKNKHISEAISYRRLDRENWGR